MDPFLKISIVLVHKITDQIRYITQYQKLTSDQNYMGEFKNSKKFVNRIIKEYHYSYRIIIIDEFGEVLQYIK